MGRGGNLKVSGEVTLLVLFSGRPAHKIHLLRTPLMDLHVHFRVTAPLSTCTSILL